MAHSKKSLPARLLLWLARSVYSHPRCFFYPQAFLVLACLFYTVARLEFSTSRNDLVGSDKRYHQNFLRFKKEFAVRDDLVAVIESEDREKNRQFAERLGTRLEAEPALFADVFFRGDLKMMGNKALQFLPRQTLEELNATLRQFEPFISDFAQASNLVSVFGKINDRFRTTDRTAASTQLPLIQALPMVARIVDQLRDSLHRPGTPPSPGINAIFNGGHKSEHQQYVTFADGTIYLVSAVVPRGVGARDSVRRLRALAQETQTEVPGVNVGITGETVLEYDEMDQARKDSTAASLVALLLVAVIFILGFREVGRPLKATACLLVGLVYTLGYTTATVGHLNILTVTFFPILVGLAIDFGIHLITRYEEELRNGESEQVALERAMENTGLGIFTGCFTTAGAFFAMALTDFKGIQEMGIITGGGILICLIPMLTLLPILLRNGGKATTVAPGRIITRAARVDRLFLSRPRFVVLLGITLCVLALTQVRKVHFDYNLLNMQSDGLPAVVFEKKLIAGAAKSVLFAAVVVDSPEQAMEIAQRLEQLPSVATIDSMSQFLTENQAEKLPEVRRIKKTLAPIEFAKLDSDPIDLSELSQTLFYTQGYLGLAASQVPDAEKDGLGAELMRLRNSVISLRRRILGGDPRQVAAKISDFQEALLTDIRETFESLKHQDAGTVLGIADLPPSLRNRFVGVSGKHLLQVYPAKNVWERVSQEQFVSQLRTVDPDVTGTPVQLLEYTTLLKDSYVEAAWYALGAIVVLIFIHFRSIRCVGIGFLPVAVGTLWMIGLMGALGIPFNPANIMTLPLVIGIGVTNGIHILNRVVEEGDSRILAKSTGKAVIVSGLTTIAGFASLIPADHRGISSLGVVMSLGVGGCMIAAVTLLPTLISAMPSLVAGYKKPSGDNARSTLGREEPR
jgi:uncharacterized protein